MKVPKMDELNKIYVETTSRCNLTCVTCIRHAWDEPFGDMKWSVYQKLIDGLGDFPSPKTIAFAGHGEPLLHERFPEMVHLAHERGLRTEMTSNAMLLTPSLTTRLIDAGLDQFTVSIDGASDDSHGAIRTGAFLEEIINNVRGLYYRDGEKVTETSLRIGIEFVAMRSNIRELPKLRGIAERIKASFILVTNVLPYTAELQDEILYNMVPSTHESRGAPYVPLWILPYMDWCLETQGPLSEVLRQQPKLTFLDINLNERNNYCPFVQAGSMAVAWHGGVSPCPPLLHSYHCFIRGRQKQVHRCEYGCLADQSLKAIWLQPDYAAFRERVRTFKFSPCTDCGGCDLGESNEEDCFGNPFPVCGDCLWARGVLRCA
jgi:MoaA/NifB/PqqE/SkfB family radical SAM enzyme